MLFDSVDIGNELLKKQKKAPPLLEEIKTLLHSAEVYDMEVVSRLNSVTNFYPGQRKRYSWEKSCLQN